LRAGAASAWRPRTRNHAQPIAPNLSTGTLVVAESNRVWVSDLTYVPTRAGWLYLAVVLDLANRGAWWAGRCASTWRPSSPSAHFTWHCRLDDHRRVSSIIRIEGPSTSSREYRQLLAQHGAQVSMSRARQLLGQRRGRELSFATLEFELIIAAEMGKRRRRPSRAVFAYIEVWYNRQRRHSTLDYVSPATYEEQQAVA